MKRGGVDDLTLRREDFSVAHNVCTLPNDFLPPTLSFHHILPQKVSRVVCMLLLCFSSSFREFVVEAPPVIRTAFTNRLPLIITRIKPPWERRSRLLIARMPVPFT